MDASARRQQLRDAGYCPLPLFGKVPPTKSKTNARKGLGGWQNLEQVTDEQIAMWAKTWPEARNTGVLTRLTPTLDLDILNEEAARAIEDFVRERYEECGHILVRIGKPPKRAILFRTIEPFAKIVANIVAANASAEKIEFLGTGQQVAVFGIHPDTKRPYAWHGGQPGPIVHDDLPYIREEEARQLVDDIVTLLVKDFGYTRAAERPRKPRKGNGPTQDTDAAGAADWQYLLDNIREGRALHDSLRDLAAKMVTAGMRPGAVVNQLRALLEGSSAARDDRWRDRYNEIPGLVESAEKFAEAPRTAPAAGPAIPIDETLKVFKRWLLLKDSTPILAVLGAVAANYLEGDPVWLGLIGPPSSAKTEILNATSQLPHVVQVATLTTAALLSGTPKKQAAKGTQGGLLRQNGSFGIVSLKDFGSVLSMHTETRLEVLAALREIWDGHWTRHVGSDGGRTLSWTGKVGLIFACTGVIDLHYSVIGAMGDRALLSRFAPAERGQFVRSLKHVGAGTAQMRKELAEAVAALFAGRKSEAQSISDQEIARIDRTIMLTVRLRGAVARDGRTRELEAVLGAEGTARIGLALERLLAGLDVLGVDRETALEVVEAVALDSVPPTRRSAYEHLHSHYPSEPSTTELAEVLELPTTTVRRVLEELAAYRLIRRKSQGQGKADLWGWRDWETELPRAAPKGEETQ
jgi:hypothetical protein